MTLKRYLSQFRVALQTNATIILRALGLHVLVCWIRSTSLDKLKKKSRCELPKVALQKDRSSALLRGSIHAVPVAGALFLAWINLYQYYVGAFIKPLALYQFVAKVHEITIQASLAAIVFSYIRHEIVLGQGIPLGALFSGLQLSQASYLWSSEFWGSLRSKTLSLGKRCSLIGVVVGAIALAAVVGPSSAILLVPRLAYWPAGSTYIWINVTADDLWPNRTDQISVYPGCSMVSQSARSWSCPSDEWQSIEDYLQLSDSALPPRLEEEFGIPTPDHVQVTGKAALRQLQIERELWKPFVNSDGSTAVATTQQAAVADALIATGTLWAFEMTSVSTGGHGVPLERLDAVHHIDADYYQPYSIGSCANDTIRGFNDERPLTFPIPPGVMPKNLPVQRIDNSSLSFPGFIFDDFTRADILETGGPTWENRLRWVELPQVPFNGSAIGAVVLLPIQHPQPNESQDQDILLCVLGAGWGPSTLNMSTREFGSNIVRSGISDAKTVTEEATSARDATPHPDLSEAARAASISTMCFLLPIYPKRPINVSLGWSRYLNPLLTDLNTTVFHRLMQSNFTDRRPGISAGIILSSMSTNGLARIGIESSVQGNLKTAINSQGESEPDSNSWFHGRGNAFVVDPEQSKDWVRLKVNSTLLGYAYNTSGAGPKVAIMFLLAYCTLAIAHLCYAAITGISSTCWDSIGEVAALAMNSAPTMLLRNTSSGITEASIFGLCARILARPDDQGEGEHLELVLGEQDEKTLEQRTLKLNRVYG